MIDPAPEQAALTRKATVLGGSGFIGRSLIAHLRASGFAVDALGPADPQLYGRPLGHVFYCIGLTADFRTRPFDTMRAHVGVLGDLLERCAFDSFVYLSSTRIYAGAAGTSETDALRVAPLDPSDLYNISKLAGEALCLQSGRDHVKAARLSNVTGFDPTSPTFLTTLIREALSGRVLLQTSLSSAKDYILLDDVCALLTAIATRGRETIYNVASGADLTNRTLVERLSALTGCEIDAPPRAPETRFPAIDVSRIRSEFGFAPQSVLDALPDLVARMRDANAAPPA